MKNFNFFNIRLLKDKRKMKSKRIIFLIASFGILSATTKPIFADEILIAHADVRKIVTVKYTPTKTKKFVKTKVLPNGKVKKIISYVKLCKRVRTVSSIRGTLLNKKVKKNVACPDVALYNQKKIFSNHKSVVKSPNHRHYQRPKIVQPMQPLPNSKVDNNSCKEGSIIGGLLGAGITMSATRGKDRWWAVPAGGTAGALIGCQIDGG
tara:strand:- start:2207 stop:2830 length:624 start_codon:yes stop_codon:yes gene_type:complete